jgi:hypothetical protein
VKYAESEDDKISGEAFQDDEERQIQTQQVVPWPFENGEGREAPQESAPCNGYYRFGSKARSGDASVRVIIRFLEIDENPAARRSF